MRLPPGVPHDACRDQRSTPHAALPAPLGAADGADEEPRVWPADGDRCGVQQAAAAQGELFSGTAFRERGQKGNGNRATLAVARKMVAYLLAVDRQQRDFMPAGERRTAAA